VCTQDWPSASGVTLLRSHVSSGAEEVICASQICRGNQCATRSNESDWRSKVSDFEQDPIGKAADFSGSWPKPRALPVHPWSKQRGFKRDQSVDAKFVSRRLAGSSICDDIEVDLLPLVEGAQPGTLDRTDMNEDVFAAVGRFDKAKAFLAVEPLYSARTHEKFLSLAVHTGASAREASLPFSHTVRFWKNA
jgi:hypothetical protein